MSFKKEIKRFLADGSDTINDDLILEVYKYQYKYNTVYREYANSLRKTPQIIQSIQEIPFLPISFFKNHRIQTLETGNAVETAVIFYSSGTTSSNRSSHYVTDADFYKWRSQQLFEATYGDLSNCIILAVLPSYEENPSSSLIYMIDHFMKATSHEASGFYSFSIPSIKKILHELKKEKRKIIVWGVSYALLDWAEEETDIYTDVIFMETGGMKGRRTELSRPELHARLKKGFSVSNIHSEYGMTELLSQAYSTGEGLYHFPIGFSPILRETNDPFHQITQGNGAMNLIDLANMDSCCFIETQDIGRIANQSFEILGRMDASDMRGCNLLYM